MNFPRFRTLALMGLLGLATLASAPAQEKGTEAKPGVRDPLGMFSAEAVKKADAALAAVFEKTHWQGVIETVESLDGQTASEAARANVKAQGVHGIYVLIAKKETKIQVEPSDSAKETFTKAADKAIVEAFTKSFRAKNFDQGLADAVEQIRVDAEAKPSPGEPSAVPADVYDTWIGAKAGLRDSAALFSAEAAKKADATLAEIHRKTRWQGVIETVETLGGKTAAEVAMANFKQNSVHGIYVLIAKKETKIQVERSDLAKGTFTKEAEEAIVAAFTKSFRAKNFDQGLLDAVDLIRTDAEAKPSETKEHQKALTPAAVIAPQAGAQAPPPPAAAEPIPAPVAAGGGTTWLLVIGGLGVVFVLWAISRSFKQPQQQGFQNPGGYGPNPNANPNAGRGVPPQGYGPPPQQGSGGYYPPQGYGPAPQQGGGGGFMAGALGGLGGAVVGNMLYDKFGRPREGQGAPQQGFSHHEGGMLPPTENVGAGAWPGEPDPSAQPADSYDPNGGVGGDWGSADPAPEPDQGAGGDWGSSDPAPEPDAGTGGDWGGDSGGGSSDDQGGNW